MTLTPSAIDYGLTSFQVRHLLALLNAGAVSSGMAMNSVQTSLPALNPATIAELSQAGFISSRIKSYIGAPSITLYWLTMPGRGLALALRRESAGK